MDADKPSLTVGLLTLIPMSRYVRNLIIALAVLAVAAAASGVLPRWLRYAGTALAITITASGVAYLLLLQGLASLAVLPAGVLLLAFITGAGITLGTSAGKPRRGAPATRTATAKDAPDLTTAGARK